MSSIEFSLEKHGEEERIATINSIMVMLCALMLAMHAGKACAESEGNP